MGNFFFDDDEYDEFQGGDTMGNGMIGDNHITLGSNVATNNATAN